LLIRGVKTYLQAEKPVEYLFNGQADKDGGFTGISTRGVQWVMRQARQHSGIKKQITAHTLRHSYATHLLEMGLDIMTLKDLLGHAEIRSTLVYLHVSRINKQLAFSPLDRLYNYGSQKK
jgi:site-specific recombinase XerD